MSARILIARHPETKANVARRYRGRGDEPYTPKGREQVSALAEAIRAFGPQVVYSSPQRRALEAAEASIGASGASLTVLEGLREIDFGDAEGLTYEQTVLRGVPVDYLGGPTAEPVAPGGETWDAFAKRVAAAAAAIEDGGRAAVFTHSGVVRALLVGWLGLPREAAWGFALPPASLILVSVEAGQGVLEYLGPPEWFGG